MAYVVDVGGDVSVTGQRAVDINGNNHGYVVSHVQFGKKPYFDQRDWLLTLTDLRSYEIEVEFDVFRLPKPIDGECPDYLLISTTEKLCNRYSQKLLLNLSPSTNITFNLVSDGEPNKKASTGFWIEYRGNLLSNQIL